VIVNEKEKGGKMLWTVALVLIILWLFGLITSYTLGGFIHVLLVIAIITILVRIIKGKNPIKG
jgi:hypothetical protein